MVFANPNGAWCYWMSEVVGIGLLGSSSDGKEWTFANLNTRNEDNGEAFGSIPSLLGNQAIPAVVAGRVAVALLLCSGPALQIGTTVNLERAEELQLQLMRARDADAQPPTAMETIHVRSGKHMASIA